jgi:aarF domain-containing kinase
MIIIIMMMMIVVILTIIMTITITEMMTFTLLIISIGIGLSVDEDYAILQECYPYLAKRLFSDNSPRSREVLRSMLVSKNGLISPTKLLEMSEGFSTYTSSTAGGLVDVGFDGVGGVDGVGRSKGEGGGLVLSSSSTVRGSRGSSSSSSKVGMALSSSAFAQAQEELVDLLLDPKGNAVMR